MSYGLLLIACLLHQASQAGRDASLQLSVWQTGVCCIYNGLTQGQGHTVRHPLLFVFFEPNFGLVYLQLIPRGLPFRIQYTVKKLTKNTVTSLYCETIGYGVPFDSTLIPVKFYVHCIQCGCWSLCSTFRGLP